MCSDQRQPGWNVYRPISPPASFTTSTVVWSGLRTSSGFEKSLTSIAMCLLLCSVRALRSGFEDLVERGAGGPPEPGEPGPGGELGQRLVARAEGVLADLRLRGGGGDG